MAGLVFSSCDRLAKVIWTYCSERNTWLSAILMPGKENNKAHYKPRLLNDNTEWKLDPQIFQKILKLFSVKPEIDIFAPHLNYQVPVYVSWNPDKNAHVTDTFSISWENLNFYAFPPFSLTGTSISKIRREMAVGIMIIPWWLTQFWFPMMVPLLQDFPVALPPNVSDTTVQQEIIPYPVSENETTGSSFIGETFRYTELPSEVTKVILESWRLSRTSRCESVLKRWHKYVTSRNEDPYSPDGMVCTLTVAYTVGYVLLAVHCPVLLQLGGA